MNRPYYRVCPPSLGCLCGIFEGIARGWVVAGCSGGGRYDQVSSFFSDLFDISYDFLGDSRQADEIVRRGSLEEGSFAALYLGEGHLQAAFIMGRPQERHPLEEFIRRRADLVPLRDRLSDPQFPLGELVS